MGLHGRVFIAIQFFHLKHSVAWGWMWAPTLQECIFSIPIAPFSCQGHLSILPKVIPPETYIIKLIRNICYWSVLIRGCLAKEVSKSNFRQYGQMKSRAGQRQREEKN
jgi:hypothetical protein